MGDPLPCAVFPRRAPRSYPQSRQKELPNARFLQDGKHFVQVGITIMQAGRVISP
jgi:hypothetical protein